MLGATEFSSEIADVAMAAGWQVDGFVENLERSRLGTLDGLPVRWIDDVVDLASTHAVVCGLGTTHRAGYIEQAQHAGFRFATVVHPSAVVSDRAQLEAGVIIGAASVIAAHARVHECVLINRGVLIGHHTEISACSTIGPGSNIAGGCQLGARVYVGMSAVVLDHLRIGERSVIAGGAVVTEDVDERVLVAGVPATVRRRDIDGK